MTEEARTLIETLGPLKDMMTPVERRHVKAMEAVLEKHPEQEITRKALYQLRAIQDMLTTRKGT